MPERGVILIGRRLHYVTSRLDSGFGRGFCSDLSPNHVGKALDRGTGQGASAPHGRGSDECKTAEAQHLILPWALIPRAAQVVLNTEVIVMAARWEGTGRNPIAL